MVASPYLWNSQKAQIRYVYVADPTIVYMFWSIKAKDSGLRGASN